MSDELVQWADNHDVSLRTAWAIHEVSELSERTAEAIYKSPTVADMDLVVFMVRLNQNENPRASHQPASSPQRTLGATLVDQGET